jgi:hypothetical protein
MKKFLILSTLILTVLACSGSKKFSKDGGVPIIFYEANTRGFFLAIKVENQVIYTSNERDFKEYSNKIEISDTDWKEISALAKAVDLEKVKDLKWPTEKRYYDGAAFANIIFESKGVKYPANGFDHGFPPAEIEKLVTKITKLAEKN